MHLVRRSRYQAASDCLARPCSAMLQPHCLSLAYALLFMIMLSSDPPPAVPPLFVAMHDG